MIAVLLGIFMQFGVPPTPTNGCVVDEAGVLSPADFTALQNGCQAARGKIVIAVVSSTRGEGSRYVDTLFQRWNLLPSYALVMVSPADRKWGIAVGGDYRDSINDARRMDIGKAYGVPAFRNQLWGVGLISIEHQLAPLMNSTTPPVVQRRVTTTTTTTRRVVGAVTTPMVVHHESHAFAWILFLVLVMGFILLLYWLVSREGRREAREDRLHAERMSRIPQFYSPPVSATPPTPAPVVVTAPQAPTPIIVNSTPTIQPFRQYRSPYAPPVVVVDPFPVYTPPIVEVDIPVVRSPVIEEVTTTTTTVEDSYSPPSSSGGSFDDSSSNSSYDSGGSFDSGGSDSSSGGDF